MNRFAYARPADLAAARSALGVGAVAWGGGCDLLDLMKEGLLAPDRVVDLKRGALDGKIEPVEGGLRIGALATLSQVAANARVREGWPAVAEAAGGAATPHVRNVATVAGNLLQRPRCWYFRSLEHHCLKKGGKLCFAQDGENRFHAIFDNAPCAIVHPSNLAPALIAHGAAVRVLAAGEDEARSVPAADLFVRPADRIERESVVDPDDLLLDVFLPDSGRTASATYVELREKRSFDWALVACAVALWRENGVVKEARVVQGQVAPVPWRSEAAEKALVGKAVSDATARAAGAAAADGATPLEGNGYKAKLVEVVVRRAALEAAGR